MHAYIEALRLLSEISSEAAEQHGDDVTKVMNVIRERVARLDPAIRSDLHKAVEHIGRISDHRPRPEPN